MENAYLPHQVLQVGVKEREEGRGKKDGRKRRRRGGKNMFSSLLAGIRGCTFELALIYQSGVETNTDLTVGFMV